MLTISQKQIFCEALLDVKNNSSTVNAIEKHEKLNQFLDYVKHNSLNDVKKFLKQNKNFDIDTCDMYGFTALMWACYSGDFYEMVKLLIKHGADINKKSYAKMTPLMFAAKYGYSNTVDILLKSGAHVDEEDSSGKTALINATEHNSLYTKVFGHQTKVVISLVKHGCNVNKQDKDGQTALIYAAKNGHCKKVEYLIMHSANMEIIDIYQQTALLHALYGNYFDVKIEDPKNQRNSTTLTIALLLRFKANVNAQDYMGRTPLMIALKRKLPIEIIQLLLENGADTTLKDMQDQSASMYAHKAGIDYDKLFIK